MTLALKYRPKKFADVIGQKHVTAVLRAMLAKGSLPAGFIFAGPRGTGKTTTARILAAALNCRQKTEGSLEPCGQCSTCKEIQDSVSTSVLEIDAASHGLVDDVRKLREIANYAHSGAWRVFILDEAHSMSREAFNALLKILEEPPERVLFILATTEPDRILETVRSRLMGFDFRRMSEADIIQRLKTVLTAENILYEDDALVLIAQRVEGGMRDALMVVDQIQHMAGGVTVAGFKNLFGVVDQSTYVRLMTALVKGDAVTGLRIVDEYFQSASEGLALVDGLMAFLRDLLLVKQGALKSSVDPFLVESLSVRNLMDMLAILWDLRVKVKHTGSSHRVLTDVGIVMLLRALGKTAVEVKVAEAVRVLGKDEITSVLEGLG